MTNLLKFNLKQLLISRGMLKILILSSVILITALSMMNNREYVEKILPSLIILIPIITLNCFIDQIFKLDYEKGILDFFMITQDIYKIIISKFISIFFIAYLVVIITSLFAALIYNLNIKLILNIILGSFPVMVCSSILYLNLSIINVYFENRSNLISSIIIPFIFPALIVFGLFIESGHFNYLYILFGLGFIIFPVCFYLSKVLLNEL